MLAYGFYFISEFLGFAETGVGLVCDLRHYRNYIVVQLLSISICGITSLKVQNEPHMAKPTTLFILILLYHLNDRIGNVCACACRCKAARQAFGKDISEIVFVNFVYIEAVGF